MDINDAPENTMSQYAQGVSSGHDDNPWATYLGPMIRPQAKTPYGERNISKWNMPDAYVGENEWVRDTMVDYMFTAERTEYTDRIMPWYPTDNIHILWTQWENNAHYMGITPHQAPSKTVTSKRKIRKANMARRGIAGEFEIDMVSTPMGGTVFQATVGMMARSVQETANVEVVRALLGCHRYQQEYLYEYEILRPGDLDKWWQRRVDRFGKAQKAEHGLGRLDAEISEDMDIWGGRANLWILPRAVSDYVRFKSEMSEYYRGGPEAVARVNGVSSNPVGVGGSQMSSRSLNPPAIAKTGTPVFLTNSFVIDGSRRAELMSRRTEIGIYNTMMDRCTNYKTYTSEERKIRVYSNHTDDWVEIGLEEAVRHAVCWDENTGKLSEVSKMSGSRVNTAELVKDLEYDFLSFKDNSANKQRRNNLKHIGDMSSAYLKNRHLLAAGQTLLNAMGRSTGMNSVDLENTLNTIYLRTRTGPVGGSQGVAGDFAANQGAGNGIAMTPDEVFAVQAFTQAMISQLGEDNLFVKNTEDIWKTFFMQGLVPAARVTDLTAVEEAGGEDVVIAGGAKEKLINAHFQILKTPVPESYHEQFDAIVANTGKSVEERSGDIKKLVEACNKEDKTSTGNLKNSRLINKWFTTRMKNLSAKMAEVVESQSAAAASSASSSAASQTRYFPAHAIPSGWKAQSAVRASMGSAPSKLEHFSALHRYKGIGASVPSARSLRAAEKRRDERPVVPFDGVLAPAVTRRFNNMANYISDLSKSSAPVLVRWAAQLYLGAEFTRDRFLNFVANNIYVPMQFILARPHCLYKTLYGIKMQDNGGTGYTFVGHGNMMISHTASHKVGLMHFTMYMQPVVLNPKNCWVQEDLFVREYLGGMGTQFWKVSEYASKGANRQRKDILCLPLPPNMRHSDLRQRIDIRGREMVNRRLRSNEQLTAKPLFPGAWRNNRRLRLPDLSTRGLNAMEIARMGRRKVGLNYVCHQGVEFYFNAVTRTFTDFTIEKGHFGANVYPGVGKIRNGQKEYVERPGYIQRAM